MEINFQVSSCDEDLTSMHNTLSGYFIDYNFLKCGTGDDFMSYVTSRVQVPLTNDQESFNKTLDLRYIFYVVFDDLLILSTIYHETDKYPLKVQYSCNIVLRKIVVCYDKSEVSEVFESLRPLQER